MSVTHGKTVNGSVKWKNVSLKHSRNLVTAKHNDSCSNISSFSCEPQQIIAFCTVFYIATRKFS